MVIEGEVGDGDIDLIHQNVELAGDAMAHRLEMLRAPKLRIFLSGIVKFDLVLIGRQGPENRLAAIVRQKVEPSAAG